MESGGQFGNWQSGKNKINQTQFFLDEGIDFTKTRLLATTLLSGAL